MQRRPIILSHVNLLSHHYNVSTSWHWRGREEIGDKCYFQLFRPWDYPSTKSVLWRLKCTKLVFRPAPRWGSLQRSPDSSWWGGGSLPHTQESHLRSRTSTSIFGPSGLKLQLPNSLNFLQYFRDWIKHWFRLLVSCTLYIILFLVDVPLNMV